MPPKKKKNQKLLWFHNKENQTRNHDSDGFPSESIANCLCKPDLANLGLRVPGIKQKPPLSLPTSKDCCLDNNEKPFHKAIYKCKRKSMSKVLNQVLLQQHLKWPTISERF